MGHHDKVYPRAGKYFTGFIFTVETFNFASKKYFQNTLSVDLVQNGYL